MGTYNGEKRMIVSSGSWRQTCGQRSRGRQRKRWIDVVKHNMEDLQLNVEDAENRAEWRRRGIHSLKERERERERERKIYTGVNVTKKCPIRAF